MRVAVVAGPDPGHAFPAIALCLAFLAAGDRPTLLTGSQWLAVADQAGIEAELLAGLDPVAGDDDADSGAKLHRRAARMALLNVSRLEELAPDLVVSDVITSCGGMAAEMVGIPWVELNPHPLYRPSRGLPPLGSGLAPGSGLRGRARDVVLRALTARSWREGLRQRTAARAEIGLPAVDPGPRRRLIATLPALEVPRPDWPAEAVVVGPLHFEPTSVQLEVPDGTGPVVVVAPSTAVTGAAGLAEVALEALVPGVTLPVGARVVVSRLGGERGDGGGAGGERSDGGGAGGERGDGGYVSADGSSTVAVPPWAVVGLGRQDALLSRADLVICGGGHGMVAKTLLAGVPMVVVPGGGDQWEIANRVVRQGSAQLIRPLTSESLTAAVGEVLASPGYRARARLAGESAADVADPVRVCHDALARSR